MEIKRNGSEPSRHAPLHRNGVMTRASGRKPRNVGASVRDRLTQRARANADNAQLALTR
jgi:hypothetical protein